MKKRILQGKKAKEKLLAGTKAVYDAVGSSYSPRGRMTSIGRPWGYPIALQDGVSIAKEVGSEDVFVDQGIMTIVEAAKKQVELVGDGTTVVTILAHQLYARGLKLLDKGINPAVIRKQINQALPSVLEELKKITTPIKGKEDLLKIAKISAASDEIADIVVKAVTQVGDDGQVTVEENKIPVMEVAYSEGMQIEKGYATDYLITDEDHMQAILDNPAVIVLRKRITTQLEALMLIDVVIQRKNTKTIFVVGEVEGDALRVFVANKLKNIISCVVIAPPASGERRKDLLDDIALVCGAYAIDKDDIPLNKEQFALQFKDEWIGQVKTVVAEKNQTLLVRMEESDVVDAEDKKKLKDRNAEIEKRVKLLREKRDSEESIYTKEVIEERLAKLTTGVATIKIGAKVNVSVREPIERAKDALAAVKACKKEGIVAGGGVAFLQLAKTLEGKKRNYGEELLYQVLQTPIQKLLENSGELERTREIIDEIKAKGKNFGYNCETEQIEDLVKSGVIDPSQVVRVALENSISVAMTLLLTQTIIVDSPENNNMRIG